MPKWCDSKIVSKRIWTDGLFTIGIEGGGVQEYKTGQFLHLAVEDTESSNIDTENDETDKAVSQPKIINRPYSVASPHGDVLEFFIVLVPEGELTPRLWKLDVGDSLKVSERAAGSFTLAKSPDAECLWLVSTGTGLAPYIAMLRTGEPWERYKKIVVVHGVRYEADLGYTDELKEIGESRAGQFTMVQSLTREESENAMYGRIPALLEDGSLERAADFEMTADNSTVMLCGNPAMLDDMESKLGTRGMKKHRSKSPGQIVLERYW